MEVADGHFDLDNVNNWQHADMYLAFLASGIVDLVGYYGVLPEGTEQVRKF
jgi:Tfp pilus assembly protein PilO